MNWPTILTIVFGSSVLSTAMTVSINWIYKKQERSRNNSYIALSLSHSFERYAHRCIGIVSDDQLYISSGGHAGNRMGMPPKPFDLPDDNFRDFDLYLLDRLFEFPQKVFFATDEVSFLAEVSDEEDARSTSAKNTIELAHIAITLADQLRKKYNLPKRTLKFGNYDLRKELDKMSIDLSKST